VTDGPEVADVTISPTNPLELVTVSVSGAPLTRCCRTVVPDCNAPTTIENSSVSPTLTELARPLM